MIKEISQCRRCGLPKEVLNLFPMWDYQCPICQTYVEPSISFCPNCKMPFNADKWRVPPRFLKSKEAMSEYAHKVLAPKLNPEQRELLFKYFTELFNDGFESGNFSAWTGTYIEADWSLVVNTTRTHHGTYSCQLVSDSTQNDEAYCYKTLASTYDELYARMYINFDVMTHGSTYRNFYFLTLILSTNTNNYYSVAYRRTTSDSSGILYRRWRHDTNWIEGAPETSFTFSLDIWYCVEMRFKRATGAGNNDGIFQIWVDGTLYGNLVNIDNDEIQLNQIRVGKFLAPIGWTSVTYNDCVVVADTYIGLEGEVAGQPYINRVQYIHGMKTW